MRTQRQNTILDKFTVEDIKNPVTIKSVSNIMTEEDENWRLFEHLRGDRKND